jgi:Pin2-interacting protein X1
MLGIGMRHQNGVDGSIAWRQNRDFEDLLRRLNGGTETEAGTTNASFHNARESESESKDDDGNEEQEGVMTKKEKKKKKKKRKASEGEEGELEDLDNDRKERKKKRKKSSKDGHANAMPGSVESESVPRPPREAPPADESGSAPMASATSTAITVNAPVPVRAPPRTHRARFIAAKRMAASNSTALAEILGIPSSSSSSAVASPAPVVPAPAPASTTATTTEAQDSLQKLTTSSQSVGDYFKAKLGAKAHRERQAPRSTLAAVVAATAPPDSARDDDDDGRAGLGLGRGPPRGPPQDSWDEEPVRGGIGASSSRLVTMFMPGQPTIEAREDITTTAGVELAATHDATDHDDGSRKSEKRRAKEQRRREKEERRRKRAEAGQVDRGTVDVPVDEEPAAGAKKKHREPA